MTARWLLVLLFSALVAVACGETTTSADVQQATQLYTCSMHPQVVQDGPGSCPLCGMDLTPMGAGSSDGPVVEISPGVVQQMGVETAPVEPTSVFRHIRTVGEVEVGEDELAVVNLRFSGWVEKLRVERTGDEVRPARCCSTSTAPSWSPPRRTTCSPCAPRVPTRPLAAASARQASWSCGSSPVPGHRPPSPSAGEASRTMPIRAPKTGFVLHKDLVEGGRVAAGKDLYRIGNLQRIWVTAEVYEHDAPWVDVGQKPAQLELTHLAGQVIEGQVSLHLPDDERREPHAHGAPGVRQPRVCA